jgi:hypothetical protein
LSDFNSDWRSDRAEDWVAECFSIIYTSAILLAMSLSRIIIRTMSDHSSGRTRVIGWMSGKRTHPRYQLPNTFYLTPDLPHFTSPALLSFPNRDNSFFNIINHFVHSFPIYQLSPLSLFLSPEVNKVKRTYPHLKLFVIESYVLVAPVIVSQLHHIVM